MKIDVQDFKKHNNFNIYYDVNYKRNYWVLGYFGGGSVNISSAMQLAEQYAKENNVPLDTVAIDEIFKSRKYKGFKFMYSGISQTAAKDAEVMDNVFEYLTS